jgi:hypothetical protein
MVKRATQHMTQTKFKTLRRVRSSKQRTRRRVQSSKQRTRSVPKARALGDRDGDARGRGLPRWAGDGLRGGGFAPRGQRATRGRGHAAPGGQRATGAGVTPGFGGQIEGELCM